MKRIGNLYPRICSIENLVAADVLAQKGKSRQTGVIQHNLNQKANLTALQAMLLNKTFKTSDYETFKIHDPKERTIFKLPYYPDRILHHAVMNILKPVFLSVFTADTYSCIEGRGVHLAAAKLKNALRNEVKTKYCLKLDIRQFYPSVNHDTLKKLLRRKFKDNDLLHLLDGIIDSTEGLPIGNYLSMYFANFYLTGFDHWLKEVKKVKYYWRYADDIVILSDNKAQLHRLLAEMREYLHDKLQLSVKANYQVFPVADRGIDFLGYRFFQQHTLIRKSIKKNFIRMVKYRNNTASIASYNGWLSHCNSKNLINKYLKIA